MDASYPHLSLPREDKVNEKRPGSGPRLSIPPDPRGHGQGLRQQLATATQQAAADLGGFDDRRLFRFLVQKGFNPDDLRKISTDLEFVSQEEDTVVIGFATNAALAQFESRLASLSQGEKPTNVQVLYALQGIANWKPEDRTGWALKRYGFPARDQFLLDVELWPMEDHPQERTKLWDAFEAWLSSESIESVDRVRQLGLTLYRVRCNQDQGNLLLRHRDVRSVDLPPSFGLERSLLFQDIQRLEPVLAPPPDAPGIGVLDSGISAGHPLLAPAVKEARSFLPNRDAADDHGHGTQVAGLALYGDFDARLREASFVPSLHLYSGRILDEENTNDTGFVENQIEEAVRHFNQTRGCKVFNLSLGDRNKPYTGGHLKGLSLTLDTLSRELGILFVVSAGNHIVGEDSPDGLEWRDRYPDYLTEDAWKIIEPAPALNVLTVGSLARYDRTFNSQRYTHDPAEIPIAHPDQPSPFTRHGTSVDGAIKPELMAYGGNWAINTRAGNNLLDRGQGLGVISTSREFAPPSGRPFAIDCGTSFAAPQVAHLAASLLRERPEASANLLRALLCANAAIPPATGELIDKNKDLKTACGYGMVDQTALHRSLENAVTLLAEDTLQNKCHHFYEVPLPQEFLDGRSRSREIVVALAYTPQVRSTRIKYRATRIDFRLVAARDLEHLTQMFNKATPKEDYKNIPDLNGAAVGQEVRSKGTVQADIWKFLRFDARSKLHNNRLFVVVTRNDFPWGEPLCAIQEEYSLVVGLRDRANEEARLYSQLRTRLQPRLTQRIRV